MAKQKNPNQIYLDHAAMSPICKEAYQAMLPFLNPNLSKKQQNFANPSSIHGLGQINKSHLQAARTSIANSLSCNFENIIFTSCGTESINLAIIGAANRYIQTKNKAKGHIITSQVEHAATLNACKELERQGFKVTYLSSKDGTISLQDLKKAITKDTFLISLIYANNELGTINKIKQISKIATQKGILFHADACQAPLYLNINTKQLGVDFLTINSIKINGPAGAAALYVKDKSSILPILHGGHQEQNLRPGTQNLPAIIAFAKALEIAVSSRQKTVKKTTELKKYFVSELKAALPNIKFNSKNSLSLTNSIPSIINVMLPNIDGEILLKHLSSEGIYCSTGSACNQGETDPSHVLLAIGLSKQEANSSLRFSISKNTLKSDLKFTAKTLINMVKILNLLEN